MTNASNHIMHEDGDYYVIKTSKAYVIYQHFGTHSVRCATIGLSLGMDRVRGEIARRKAV